MDLLIGNLHLKKIDLGLPAFTAKVKIDAEPPVKQYSAKEKGY